MRVCSTHGCSTIYPSSDGSRCAACTKAADQRHWARTRAYNTRGHRLRFRLGVLGRDPICVLCLVAQSTDADHYPLGRDELVEQGMDADDPVHGRGLCSACHKRETALHQPGGWHARDTH